VIVKFDGTEELNENEVQSRIRRNGASFIEIERISDFSGCGQQFSEDTWTSFCKQKIFEAKREATLNARKWVKKKMLEDALQKKNIERNLKELNFYDESNVDTIKWGFDHLEVQLDSVVYLEL